MKDGEKVFQYVKSNIVMGKIGVHGESMGGCVASFIAKKCNVDFVFVDRTFSSLVDVAYWTIGGKVVANIFKFLTRWTDQCWLNFYEIKNTYKVFGGDCRDTMITDLSSLKNAIAKSLVEEKLTSNFKHKKLTQKISVTNHLLNAKDHESLRSDLYYIM